MNGIAGAGLAPAHMARPRLRTTAGATTTADAANGNYALRVEDLNVYYAKFGRSGGGVNIEARRITALIGLSGCGKSTALRCFRMNDLIPTAQSKERGSRKTVRA
jgi:ABC-type glutathione transport system ATPase component